MKLRTVVAVGLGIICGFILASLWNTTFVRPVGAEEQPQYPEVDTLSQMTERTSVFADYESYLAEVAKKKGGEYAFSLMKTGPLPFGLDTHLLGHVVGDILYAQKGVDGMAYCTHDFRNACSHTIVIGALLEFGTAAVERIRSACESAPGGPGAYTMCFHGLGHGVLAFNGYEMEKTVEMCRRFGTNAYHYEESEQCFGGAVMEIIGGGGHDREAWEKRRTEYLRRADPLGLCNESYLTEGEQLFCYLYITPYLLEAVGADAGHPSETDFARVFLMCDTLAVDNQRLRDACFGGLGKEFIGIVAGRNFANGIQIDTAGYEQMHEWCALAKAPDGIAACERSVVGSLFWGGENPLATAQAFCDTTEASLRSSCYMTLTEEVDRYVSDESDRATLCQEFPKDMAAQCTATLLEPSYESE